MYAGSWPQLPTVAARPSSRPSSRIHTYTITTTMDSRPPAGGSQNLGAPEYALLAPESRAATIGALSV